MDKAVKALEALDRIVEALDRLTFALACYEDYVCEDLHTRVVDVGFQWDDVDLIREALEQLKEKE